MRKILSCIRFAVILTLAVSMLLPVSPNVRAAEAETESSLAGGASGATEKLSSGGGEAPLSPLWQVGNPDNSSAEFAADYADGIENVSIPADSGTWSGISKGMKGDVNGTLNISFDLPEVPEHGVQFSFKVLDASNAIPQLAVFTNGMMSGLIQITGLNNGQVALENTWKQTYKLYIPKEQLRPGENELQLKLDRGLYADAAAPGYDGDKYLWFVWDYFKLEALTAPAAEPLHGRYVHLGTTLMNRSFKYDENSLRHLAPLTKWMGVAYSGNWMRVAYWSDTVSEWKPQGRNYLLALRELNLQPMLGFLGGNWRTNPSLAQGVIPAELRDYYRNFVAEYGDLYEYMEVNNEPGVFNWPQQTILATARLLDEERRTNDQPYLKIVAPGWAYWPYKGIPDGWERDAEQRRPIEEIADITNGHSYGGTGVQPVPGGALYENLRVYPDADEGFGKEMAMSEAGANDNHADNTKYGTYAYRFAAAFDRELRGDIGYADHIMQHAAFFYDNADFGLFDSQVDWNTHRYEDTRAVSANAGEPGETRLKTFRRLAAAYATHGSPLTYEILNKDELAGKKAYFRGVDTSALGTSTVGASADKLLLSFVNFEKTPVTMRVSVTMPEQGQYAGERFGPGETYDEAHSWVNLSAGPALELEVTLGAGETVQYILDKYEGAPPEAPQNAAANAVGYNEIALTWEMPAGAAEATEVRVYRNGQPEPVMTVPGKLNFFHDRAVTPNTEYSYQLEAVNEFGETSPLTAPVSAVTPVLPVTPPAEGDPTKFEAEATQFAAPLVAVNRAGASGGKAVEQTHRGSLTILGYSSASGGDYTLTVAYASQEEAKKNVLVNGTKAATITLPATGGWTGTYAEKKFTIRLQAGYNNIEIANAGGGSNIDYFRLEEGAYEEESRWHPVEHDDEAILYSGFAAADNGVSHVSSTPGSTASLYFNGTGIRWRSDIRADMGRAEVYVDGELKGTVNIPEAGLEGEDKEVFRLDGLENGLHRIDIAVKEGKVMVHGFEYEGAEASLPVPQADMIVTEVGWNIVTDSGEPADHETPQVGDSLIFWAKVKNVGARPTPLNATTGAGMITGGAFSVNGGTVSWSDTYANVIDPGEEVLLTANGSAQGTPQWIVPAAGEYRISFLVNDIKRYPEMNRDNNTGTVSLHIGS